MNLAIKTPYSMRVILVLGLALVACLPLSTWSTTSTSRPSNVQDISLSSVDARGSSVSHQTTDRVGLTLNTFDLRTKGGKRRQESS
jgi:hypothetical protein